LALSFLSRGLLDDEELRAAADRHRAQSRAAIEVGLARGESVMRAHARVDDLVPRLSLDARWRHSVELAGRRQMAREQLTKSVREMTLRWGLDPSLPVVELVPTSLLQLVSYTLLLELRGDEGVGQCLECQRPLPEVGVHRGRPRLYCPPGESGRNCAVVAENRQRRQARRCRLYTPIAAATSGQVLSVSPSSRRR
jgi:hypothetical protein